MDTERRLTVQRVVAGLVVLVVLALMAYGAYSFFDRQVEAQEKLRSANTRRPLQGVRDQIQKAADHTLPDQQFFDDLKR